MVSHLTSVILVALSLQLLSSTDGRTMKADVDRGVVNVASPNNTLLNYASTTNYDDAKGLVLLTTAYPQLTYGSQFPLYTSDPCYPQQLGWIICSNDPIRRVIVLGLGNTGLTAPLPDFSSMDALVKISLFNNQLSGPIPEFLGTLPELTYLNLAYNRFTGSVPASLSGNYYLQLITTGNPLCSSANSCSPPSNPTNLKPPPPGRRGGGGGGGGGGEDDKSNLPTILGVTITPAFLLSVAVAVYLQCCKKESGCCSGVVAGVGACAGGVPH